MATKIENSPAFLKRRLRASAAAATRRSQRRFFSEPIRTLGVRTPDVQALARAAAKEYRSAGLGLDEILDVSEALWDRGLLEERVLALEILTRFKRHFRKRDWKRFDAWVGSLSNWAETDGLCIKVLAPFLMEHREYVRRLLRWARSRSRWRKRAAAVALVPIARRGEELSAAFEICESMARVRDDMVEKAVGWLLKEASRTQPRRVADFLGSNVGRFSRMTVRYASEKLPVR